MKILSWNIQYAKGVDNITDINRITKDIKALADADIICLQEVLVTPTANQVEQLSQAFPQHTPIFGAAIDRYHTDGRLQFGNLVLCRTQVQQVVHHKLPQPPEPAVKHMPRQAIEVIVPYNGSLIRVVTTHLDYFAQQQRSAQVNYLMAHHVECMQRFRQPSPQGGEEQFESLPETAFSIYCGDFNLALDSGDYANITINKEHDRKQNGEQDNFTLYDCWPLLHPDVPHEPTCGIYDHEQWQEGPHCRDFFFASKQATASVARIDVDTDTAASDHQPLVLTLS